MQNKEIDIEEIMQVLNRSLSDQQHTSLRLSDDYQPIYHRYSRQDEFQDITFDLSFEDSHSQIDSSSQSGLIITEETSFNKLSCLLQEVNEESVPLPPAQKPLVNSQKPHANEKSPLKASLRLKKKISLKKQTDQFTKKYDDLFDEIFFRHRAKEIKPALPEQEEKREHSIVSTNHQNFSASNVSENANFEFNAIEQVYIGSNMSIEAEQKNAIPKVVIAYQEKNPHSIQPKEKIGLENAPAKQPKIKFSYGQTETVSSMKQISLKSIPSSKPEQQRLPSFLVPFRNRTNHYPNFYSKNVLNAQNCYKINKQFTQILRECKQSIQSLKAAHMKLHELFENIRKLYRLMSNNIKNHTVASNFEILAFFLSIDWPNYIQVEELETIKPKDYFLNRSFNQLELITFVNNFDQILSKIEVEAVLNPEDPESIRKYMSSREQLWGIEKNLRLISQDLYLYSLSHFNLPSHIIESYEFLKLLEEKQVLPFDSHKEDLLKRLLFLQEKKDIFGSCWLGHHTIESLCNLQP